MGLRINTNIQALAAQRSLGNNTRNLDSSLEKLSSGSRINRSGDDAAGLAISERLKANLRGMKQANRNAQDGISMIQVSEGAMNEIGNILTRMRELSIQTASDTIGTLERGFVNKEIQALKSEIERISNSTEYNGMKMLDGSAGKLEFQVGIYNNPLEDRITLDTGVQVTTLEGLKIDKVDNSTKRSSQENLEMIDFAINAVNNSRSSLGALQNRLQSTINNLETYHENLSSANSRIRDTDMAEETSTLMKNNILSQASVSVLTQANQNKALALKLLG